MLEYLVAEILELAGNAARCAFPTLVSWPSICGTDPDLRFANSDNKKKVRPASPMLGENWNVC